MLPRVGFTVWAIVALLHTSLANLKGMGGSAAGSLSFIGFFGSLAADGLNVQLMVTTKQSSLDRRMIQRNAFQSCMQQVDATHRVELLFFLGDTNGTSDDITDKVISENEEFKDLVRVGGPDSDPWVARDVTYVLDRPTSRGFRLVHGSAWLAENRPDLDYVMYLDDDSYLHIPRLMQLLEAHHSSSLAMGFLMETDLDSTQSHICDFCKPCHHCTKSNDLKQFCSQFPEMAMGGCLMTMQQCNIFNDGEDMTECVRGKQSDILRVSSYFGSATAPRWFLGMGWVFGRRIVQFLGRNVNRLKKRGAADVQLGSWLAPLEGVDWVDMKDGSFHDYPMPGSTFSAACTEKTVLVHRMNQDRWQHFKPETCELHCPATGGSGA